MINRKLNDKIICPVWRKTVHIYKMHLLHYKIDGAESGHWVRPIVINVIKSNTKYCISSLNFDNSKTL